MIADTKGQEAQPHVYLNRCVGPGQPLVLGLTIDSHRAPTGSNRLGRLDRGPESAVEVGSGDEARDPDPDAGGVPVPVSLPRMSRAGWKPWSQANLKNRAASA